jgi:hypothetical protein
MFNVHNANMKPPVISCLLLAALLCAFPSESYTTDAHTAHVAAVTPIVRDVDANGSHFLVDMAHFDFKTIHIPKPETSNHVQPVDGISFTQILSSEEEPVI